MRVKGDPALPLTLVQYRDRETVLVEVRDLQREAALMLNGIAAERREASARGDSATVNRLTSTQRRLQMGNRAVLSRLNGLAGSFNGEGAQQGSLYPPTATHRSELAELRKAMLEIRTLLAGERSR